MRYGTRKEIVCRNFCKKYRSYGLVRPLYVRLCRMTSAPETSSRSPVRPQNGMVTNSVEGGEGCGRGKGAAMMMVEKRVVAWPAFLL